VLPHDDVVDVLVRERPRFHMLGSSEPQDFGIQPDVLRWMQANVPPASRTLETGSGYTTVVLCSLNCNHTAIAPDQEEFDAIRRYCESKGIGTDTLETHAAPSQRVLPALVDGPPLDFVLIDGDHAFPGPFIDWFYTADRLKQGGLLLVDDTQLRTGHILREFLRGESEWQHVQDLGKTAVFRRLTSEPLTGKWHGQQSWANKQHLVPGARLTGLVEMARRRVRLRTRIRSWRAS